MKIFCIGRNYVDHAKELNNKVPSQPMVFMKPPTALLINGAPFYYPDFSSNIHYEAELVVKIAKNGKYVAEEFALDYISAMTIGLDLTARDLQQKCKEKGHPWEIAKGFDNSAVLGSWIPFEKSKSKDLSFSLKMNGKQVQAGHTSDLIFQLETLISHISKFFTIQQGDLIYTGTPAGVGPIKIGDQLVGSLEGQELLQCAIK